jgi:hypothetical protein
MKDKIVIGIIGRAFAGKDTAIKECLKQANRNKVKVVEVSSSILLRNMLIAHGEEPTRPNRQKLVSSMIEQYGNGVISGLLSAKMKKYLHDGAQMVFLNCIRLPSDLEMVQCFENYTTVYIQAGSCEERYPRRVGSDKPDQACLTLAEFHVQDSAPTEIHIDEMGAHANIKIFNRGIGLNTFRHVVCETFNDLLLPLVM